MPAEQVVSAALSGNDTVLFGGGSLGGLYAWSASDGSPLLELKGNGQSIVTIEAHDESMLIAATSDHKLLSWSIKDQARLRSFEVGEWIRALAVGPGNSVVVGCNSGKLMVFTLGSGERTKSIAPISDGTGVSTIRFSASKQNLFVGTDDGMILIYDWPQMRPVAQLFDPAVNRTSTKGITYRIRDQITGRIVTFTQPCGTPVPAGAICVCNCVAGQYTPTEPVQYPPSINRQRDPFPPSEPRRFPRLPSPGGGTRTEPCLPRALGPNEICTCNCIPGR